jgi:phosphoesterase RecJ-like protein
LAALLSDESQLAPKMKDIPAIKATLAEPKSIVITTHSNPDADALGSSLGLGGFLQKLGHDVTVVTPTDYPDFLKWMKGNDSVVAYSDATSTNAASLIAEADLIFCLDFSDLKRIEPISDLVRSSTAQKVMIDHHLNPTDFADLRLHDTKAAATAELVYDLIIEMGHEDLLDGDIANCLYAGIMTDTGSFRHSNTTYKVHSTVAELIKHGAQISMVSQQIYDTNSLNRLRFMGYALNELLKVDESKGVAYFVISHVDHLRYQLKSGDTEGLVNYALSIKGINVAALFKEQPGEIKMSFRSVGDIAVNKFAEENFSGGGHKNAAGGISKESLDNTVNRFNELVQSNVFGSHE